MIRPAQSHDAEALHALLIDTIVGTHPANADWIRDRLTSPSSIIIVDEEQGELLGAVVGTVVLDEAEIHDVAVHPRARRQGRADRLVSAFEQSVIEMGARTTFLEVRTTNEPAKKLYVKAGFFSQQRRLRYYPDGEDALIFRKDLKAKS